MKTIIFLFLILLCACTKDRTDYACKCKWFMMPDDGSCFVLRESDWMPVDNKTQVEIENWIDNQENERYFVMWGIRYKVFGTCDCTPYKCPQ